MSLGELTVETQKEYPLEDIPKVVRNAIATGYIHEGWSLADYFRSAIRGIEMHGEAGSVVKKGWECVLTWGPQGSLKSNLDFQLAFDVYKDWDVVMKRTVMTKEEMDTVYEETRAGGRIPLINLDDVTTTLPKHLWFLDVFHYSNLHSFIAVARPRIGVLITSSPRPQNLITPIADNLTFELACFPNGTHIAERYCWFPDPQRAANSILRKVMFPVEITDPTKVPSDFWAQYEERRWRVSDYIMEQKKKFEDKEKGADTPPMTADGVRRLFPPQPTILNELRTLGFKYKDVVVQKALALYKQAVLDKVRKLTGDDTIPTVEEGEA